MSEHQKNKEGQGQEAEFDRQAYLREIRQGLLKNLGLPEDTKPENVAKLLEIKQRMKQK